jgi:3-oxoacyl-[acyl-carrier protein] reductase
MWIYIDCFEVLNVNLRGTFMAVKHFSRQMIQQKYGRIVVTSSITGPITGCSGAFI